METREVLVGVQTRLGETLEAFSVLRHLHENANKDTHPDVYELLNENAAFWQTVFVAIQHSVVSGIVAILDKNRRDCATLYHAKRQLEASRKNSIPAVFEAELNRILSTYAMFRHKLFGHNDLNRIDVIGKFNAAGFTWESMKADLDTLDYSLKALWLVYSNKAFPDRVQAGQVHLVYEPYVARAKEHADGVLKQLRKL